MLIIVVFYEFFAKADPDLILFDPAFLFFPSFVANFNLFLKE